MFDLSKQKDHIASKPIRLEIKISAAKNIADSIAYALVLTPQLIRISSDGQKHFDLIRKNNFMRNKFIKHFNKNNHNL